MVKCVMDIELVKFWGEVFSVWLVMYGLVFWLECISVVFRYEILCDKSVRLNEIVVVVICDEFVLKVVNLCIERGFGVYEECLYICL